MKHIDRAGDEAGRKGSEPRQHAMTPGPGLPGWLARLIGGCCAGTGWSAVAAAVLLLGFSPLYVVTGQLPPLTDAAAFTSYVTKNNVIGVTTKLVDTLYVAAFGLRDPGQPPPAAVGRLDRVRSYVICPTGRSS